MITHPAAGAFTFGFILLSLWLALEPREVEDIRTFFRKLWEWVVGAPTQPDLAPTQPRRRHHEHSMGGIWKKVDETTAYSYIGYRKAEEGDLFLCREGLGNEADETVVYLVTGVRGAQFSARGAFVDIERVGPAHTIDLPPPITQDDEARSHYERGDGNRGPGEAGDTRATGSPGDHRIPR